MFFKIGVLRNFAIFTGKQPCWSHFLIKFQDLKPATLIKRDSDTDVFLWNIAKLLRTGLFIEHLRWLVLEKTVSDRDCLPRSNRIK